MLEITERRNNNRPRSNGIFISPSEISFHSSTANNNTKLINDCALSILDSDGAHSRAYKQHPHLQQSPSLPPPPPPHHHQTIRDKDTTDGDGVSDKSHKQFLKLIHKVYETVERNEIRLERLDEKEIMKLEWNLVALIVDRLFLWMFIVITLGVTFGIIFSSPHAHEFIFKTRSPSVASNSQTNASNIS